MEQFLEIQPPSNIKQPCKLDYFMKSLLEKKGNNRLLSCDEELSKLHTCLYQAMGPLTKVWSDIQYYVTCQTDHDIDPEECVTLLNSPFSDFDKFCKSNYVISKIVKMAAFGR